MHYITRIGGSTILLASILGCRPPSQLKIYDAGLDGDQIFNMYTRLSREAPSLDCTPIFSKKLPKIKNDLVIHSGQIYFATGASPHQDLQQFLLVKRGRFGYIKDLGGAMPEIKIRAVQFDEIWRRFDLTPSTVVDGHSPEHVNCYLAVRNAGGELKLFSAPSRSSVGGVPFNQAMAIGELIDDAAGQRFQGD